MPGPKDDIDTARQALQRAEALLRAQLGGDPAWLALLQLDERRRGGQPIAEIDETALRSKLAARLDAGTPDWRWLSGIEAALAALTMTTTGSHAAAAEAPVAAPVQPVPLEPRLQTTLQPVLAPAPADPGGAAGPGEVATRPAGSRTVLERIRSVDGKPTVGPASLRARLTSQAAEDGSAEPTPSRGDGPLVAASPVVRADGPLGEPTRRGEPGARPPPGIKTSPPPLPAVEGMDRVMALEAEVERFVERGQIGARGIPHAAPEARPRVDRYEAFDSAQAHAEEAEVEIVESAPPAPRPVRRAATLAERLRQVDPVEEASHETAVVSLQPVIDEASVEIVQFDPPRPGGDAKGPPLPKR